MSPPQVCNWPGGGDVEDVMIVFLDEDGNWTIAAKITDGHDPVAINRATIAVRKELHNPYRWATDMWAIKPPIANVTRWNLMGSLFPFLIGVALVFLGSVITRRPFSGSQLRFRFKPLRYRGGTWRRLGGQPLGRVGVMATRSAANGAGSPFQAPRRGPVKGGPENLL